MAALIAALLALHMLMYAAAAPTPTLTPTPSAVRTVPAVRTLPATEPPTTGDDTQLQLGEVALSTISDPQQNDQYIVFGAAGTAISIGMLPGKGSPLIPAYELYAPNGNKVGEAAGVSNPASGVTGAIISGYTLPASGAYIIYAHSYKNQSTGGYSIVAGDGYTLRTLDGGLIQPGVAYRGDLLQLGDRDVRSIDLPANASISVEVTVTRGNLNPTLDMIAPDGKQVLTAPGQAGKIVSSVTVPHAGRYQVRLSAVQGKSLGSYLAAVTIRNVLPTATFALNLEHTDEVTLKDGETYTFTFQGISGETVLIEAHAHDNFDPVLELYGPDGNRLILADDVSQENVDAIIQTTLNGGAGTYTVQLHGYALTPGACTFHLKTGS